MTHPLLQTLLEDDAVTELAADQVDRFIGADARRVSVVFLTGDPAKKLETVDVIVVLNELLKAYPDDLRIGVVSRDAESEAMTALAVFALPCLVFFGGGRKLETLPKIQDWSVYAEALPRLIAETKEGIPA